MNSNTELTEFLEQSAGRSISDQIRREALQGRYDRFNDLRTLLNVAELLTTGVDEFVACGMSAQPLIDKRAELLARADYLRTVREATQR